MSFYARQVIIVNSYEKVLDQMNHEMLAADDDRVALLKEVLAAMDHPDKKFKVIHLAGTNGKGSTGAMIAQMLLNQGHRVGHFTSPALVDQREQIAINREMISQNDFVQTYTWICTQLPPQISAKDLTAFEWFTLIMLQFFANQKVDWAIIEAGLGGKDDATNAIMPPLLTIFTHIDIDHTKILGNTIKMIAYNKSQIIKPETTVFIAPNQRSEVMKVLNKVAIENGAQEVWSSAKVEAEVVARQLTGTSLIITSRSLTCEPISLKLLGDFQIDNFKTVVAVYDWLAEHHLISNKQVLIDAARQIEIPGRMQVLGTTPPIILDGAHNPDAVDRLLQSLDALFAEVHFIFVLGFLKDKNYLQMAKKFSQVAQQIFVTTPDNSDRALASRQLHSILPESHVVANAQQGVKKALQVADAKTVIVVTGSFYVVKEMFRQ